MKWIGIVSVVLAGCTAISQKPPFLTGQWGGEHGDLSLTPEGGTITFICAGGRINGPIALQRSGNFSAEGTYALVGGPVRKEIPRNTYPARYFGTVNGNEMSLQADIGRGQTLGPFMLHRGASSRVYDTRCY